MSFPSRRRFLNSSIGGFAAAVSVNSLFAADQKSTDAKPQEREDQASGPQADKPKAAPKSDSLSGANDRINVAVIGCGDRGQYHISELLSLSDHANIVALCDPDEKRLHGQATHIEEEIGTSPQTYQDVRKMLENKEIDAVAIATCNHWHSLAGIWAVQAGKDAYIEKPISHNVMEGRRLVEFARKHNKVVLHGSQARSMSAMRQAMRFLHEGNLGKITLARGLCYKRRKSIGQVDGEQKVPDSVDYDLWCGPAPMTPLHRKNLHYDWHWFWDTGNGDLGNQGVHQMDICAWGLNKMQIPSRVQCLGGRLGYVDDGETYNTQLAVLDYDDGAKVIFEVRGLESKPLRGTKSGVCNVFYGTEGTLVVNGYNDCTAYAPNGDKIEMPKYDHGATGNHFTTFIKGIKARKLDYHDAEAEAGHVSSAMCHIANISNRLGTKTMFEKGAKTFGDDVASQASLARLEEHLEQNKLKLEETQYLLGPELQFDPKTERFIGNQAANAMLTRPYRAPFVVPDHVA
jgi:predicted dehydrogenase